jgi:cation transport ATPase
MRIPNQGLRNSKSTKHKIPRYVWGVAASFLVLVMVAMLFIMGRWALVWDDPIMRAVAALAFLVMVGVTLVSIAIAVGKTFGIRLFSR